MVRWGQKLARVGNGKKKMPGALTLPLDSNLALGLENIVCFTLLSESLD